MRFLHLSAATLGALLLWTGAGCRSNDARAPDSTPLLSYTAPLGALPQAPLDVSPWRADVDGLITDALSKGRAYEMLSALCSVAPLRLSGSKGAERAVEWARQTMLDIGLENVRLEPCMVPHWERGAVERLELVAPQREPLRILALGGSVPTPAGGLRAGVIEVKSFEELEQRADQARGRIVFFNRPMDPAQHDCFAAYGGAVDQRSAGAMRAAKCGAVAVVVRSMTMRLDDSPHTGAMNYDAEGPRIPAVAISTLGAEKLSARIASGAPTELELELDCQTLPDAPSHNVVGEIVGREAPHEIVLMGGHLDAWDVGHGAHDDGAGCVHALEAARLILARGLRPRRTIRVVMFMNEENGTRGARAYYADHAGEMEHHVLALESDAGGFTPRGFSTDAGARSIEDLKSIGELVARTGANNVYAGWGGVDIAPMAASGVVLVGYRPDDERYFDHHHSERDTLDQVHPRELSSGAGAIAGLVYVVADLPQRLAPNAPHVATRR
jgi:carboxypeptidase Q